MSHLIVMQIVFNAISQVGSVGRVSPVVEGLEDSETEAVWSDGDMNLGAATGN